MRSSTFGLVGSLFAVVLGVTTGARAQDEVFGGVLTGQNTSAQGKVTLGLDEASGTFRVVLLATGMSLSNIIGAEIQDAAGLTVFDLINDPDEPAEASGFQQGGDVLRLDFADQPVPGPEFANQLAEGLFVVVFTISSPAGEIEGELQQGVDPVGSGGGGSGGGGGGSAGNGDDEVPTDEGSDDTVVIDEDSTDGRDSAGEDADAGGADDGTDGDGVSTDADGAGGDQSQGSPGDDPADGSASQASPDSESGGGTTGVDEFVPQCGPCGPLGLTAYIGLLLGWLTIKILPRRWS